MMAKCQGIRRQRIGLTIEVGPGRPGQVSRARWCLWWLHAQRIQRVLSFNALDYADDIGGGHRRAEQVTLDEIAAML